MNCIHEKMALYGEKQLSDRELLSVVLQSEEKASNLIAEFGSIGSMKKLSKTELMEVDGIDEKTAFSVKALFDISNRLNKNIFMKKISSSRDVFEVFHDRLRHEKKEYFYAILLDTKNRIIKEDLVSIGTLTASLVHPRESFQAAVKKSAASIVFVHNHPSGDPSISPEDKAITKKLKESGEILGIKVVDHIIIGNGTYRAMADEGLLN